MSVILSLLSVVGIITAAESLPPPVFEMPDSASDFESQWRRHPADLETTFSEYHGQATLSFQVTQGEETRPTWNQLSRAMTAHPGQRFEATVIAEGIAGRGGNGVVVSLGFYDGADKRISHVDNFIGPGSTGRREAKLWAAAPEQTKTVKLLLILHGFGEAHFSEARLRQLPDGSGRPEADGVLITVTEETVGHLIGFGFEDDGWFYNEHNARQGADAAAIALREERIAWMRPDYVRMFFWYNDWNPSLDAETFTWESDNMLSHYRTLDLYQRIGVRVNVCGVEWAVQDPWKYPERLARAKGALLEHLIIDRGYSCIQDYTLTNEPDIFFARAVERPAQSFETFVALHREIAREFERRGLQLNIVGSDDGNNYAWFARSVADDIYFDLTDLFASHFYFSDTSVPMASHILGDRVAQLAARTPVKPFIVAELGFQDERTQPPDINPLMQEYGYALLAMSTFLDGLNAGAMGWSVWCVHEMYYPGADTPMRFGLWDFDPPKWPVRPIYHALALMTRHTRQEDPVYHCYSSHPDIIKAAHVGNHLFWVNLGDVPVSVTVSGADISAVRAFTESSLTHHRDCSQTLEKNGTNRFTAPPASFGLATL